MLRILKGPSILIFACNRVSDIEAQYYADGEDAYAMVSPLNIGNVANICDIYKNYKLELWLTVLYVFINASVL